MAPEAVTLLVVDDSPENLVAMEAVLRRPEYQIVTAASGEEALKFLLKNDCALILMDVQMPKLDGIETARLVRSNDRTRPIPIVFMTASSRDEGAVAHGYDIGGVDYLLKPIDPGVLKAKVAAFVEMYRGKQEIRRQAQQLRDRDRIERQRALAELELKAVRRENAAQQRYRRLVEGITHAILWTIDPATLACTFVSPSAEQILGYARGDWIRTPTFWRDLVPRHEQGLLADALSSLAPGRESVPVRHGFIAADGRLARFQTELRLVETEDGGTSVRGFSVDITSATRAEEALAFLDRAGTALARTLDLEATLASAARIPVPFLADWCCVEVRPGHASAAPFTAVAHADPGCEDAVRQVAAWPELSWAAAERGAWIVTDVALRLATRRDDLPPAVAPLSMIAVPLTARGRVVGQMRLARCSANAGYGPHELRLADELGRRTAQAVDNALLYRDAREAIRVRDEFLSIASHELRTPLTPVKLHVEGVKRFVAAQFPDCDARLELTRRLDTCDRQLDRAARLVSNLLDVSRLRTGRFDLEVGECDLRELVVEVAGRFTEELARAGRRVELRATEAVRGRWDRARLDQVLTNLVSNAARYGGRQPIVIACSCDDERAVLTVSDQGPGIEEKDLARIFERFESGPDSRSHGGLGLGLYIARRIVEAHGGAIAVSSAPGAGATFTVELPLRQPLATATASPGDFERQRAAGSFQGAPHAS
jgi:PAS domain S-box-containing protein